MCSFSKFEAVPRLSGYTMQVFKDEAWLKQGLSRVFSPVWPCLSPVSPCLGPECIGT
jgi:hypothetical protein